MKAGSGFKDKNEMIAFEEKLFNEGTQTDYCAAIFNIRGMSGLNVELGTEGASRMMLMYVNGLIDIVEPEGFLCRVESDKFEIIFLKDRTDEVIAYLKGQNVVDEEFCTERFIYTYAGFYNITGECKNVSELELIKEEARRESRSNANNSPYIFFDDEKYKKVSESRKIERMFPEALKNEEFLVYYQPKVELRKYTMEGAEALCRWMHEGSMIMPFKFIPVFEKSGDICELDFYMLEHVCRDIRNWLDEGKEVVRVSVNLSRAHMGDVHLVENILAMIDKYNVPHRYIEIELTETNSDADYAELKTIVSLLDEAGVSTSVDDFGVGYSSMNLLRDMPWSVVKIDKSFVPEGSESDDDKKRVILLNNVINMTDALGMRSIAEGVETTEQIRILKESGCYLAQGYFFDKPLPKEEFDTRIDILTDIKHSDDPLFEEENE